MLPSARRWLVSAAEREISIAFDSNRQKFRGILSNRGKIGETLDRTDFILTY